MKRTGLTFIVITAALMVLLFSCGVQAQNPSNGTKWCKTTSDTVTVGSIKGEKILTLENTGKTSDTIWVKVPMLSGSWTGASEWIVAGRDIVWLTANLTEFAVRSNRDSVLLRYSYGSVGRINNSALYFRDTATFRDTIGWDNTDSSVVYLSRGLGSQYLYNMLSVTRADTFATNPDTLKVYSISEYGDTAQVGVRNLLTYNDTEVIIVTATTVKYLILDPCMGNLFIKVGNVYEAGHTRKAAVLLKSCK